MGAPYEFTGAKAWYLVRHVVPFLELQQSGLRISLTFVPKVFKGR